MAFIRTIRPFEAQRPIRARAFRLFILVPVTFASLAHAAPDEERLGKPFGYPVGNAANWYTDRTGLEVAFGNFNATLRDYARLGVVLANDGVRPDDPKEAQIIPREFLLDATDGTRAPDAFRPKHATPYLGYGYQFWIFPAERRRFAMLGVYGQSIYVDPGLKLVMVQTGANATAEAGKTSLGSDRDEFWRGVVRFYGKW